MLISFTDSTNGDNSPLSNLGFLKSLNADKKQTKGVHGIG